MWISTLPSSSSSCGCGIRCSTSLQCVMSSPGACGRRSRHDFDRRYLRQTGGKPAASLAAPAAFREMNYLTSRCGRTEHCSVRYDGSSRHGCSSGCSTASTPRTTAVTKASTLARDSRASLIPFNTATPSTRTRGLHDVDERRRGVIRVMEGGVRQRIGLLQGLRNSHGMRIFQLVQNQVRRGHQPRANILHVHVILIGRRCQVLAAKPNSVTGHDS
jgi:hypothetical protein